MLKKILLPVVAAATFALVAPSAADASPLNPVKSPAVYGGRLHIGVGVGIPIGGRRVHRARTVHSGYWTTVYETRIERVWHEPERIGYDSHGHPVYSEGHYDEVSVRVPVRVWVPTVRRVVRRGYYAPRGHISVGGVWRVR